MSIEMEQARELVSLEEQAKSAVKTLGEISMKLMRMNKDLKLSAWDWNRPGHTASIIPQGSVGVKIVDVSDRPA